MKSIVLVMILSSVSGMETRSPIDYFETKTACMESGENLVRNLISTTLRLQNPDELETLMSYSFRCD